MFNFMNKRKSATKKTEISKYSSENSLISARRGSENDNEKHTSAD